MSNRQKEPRDGVIRFVLPVRFSEHVIFCKPDNSRAADPNELVDYCGCSKEIIEDVKQAVLKAKELNYELVVVCGSIYTVGEVLIK